MLEGGECMGSSVQQCLHIWGQSLAGAATSIIFVATKVLLWQMTNMFVMTKHVFCRRVCHNKSFVTTKMILVAAPTNDRGPGQYVALIT